MTADAKGTKVEACILGPLEWRDLWRFGELDSVYGALTTSSARGAVAMGCKPEQSMSLLQKQVVVGTAVGESGVDLSIEEILWPPSPVDDR